jgi:Flp pilus assembly protein TadG
MIGHLSLRRMSHSEGSTLVEFGLTILILLIFIAGIIEMGRLVLAYTTVANSARAGARYAIVHGADLTSGASGPGNDPPAVLTVVKNFASAGTIVLNDSNISVRYSPSNTAGSTVTVTVVYTYSPMFGYFSSLLNVRLGSTSQGVITF